MKNLFLIITVFLVASTLCFAQGNLQFNEVKYYEINQPTSPTTYIKTHLTITVPPGKVLKLESGSVSQIYDYLPAYERVLFEASILLNGSVIMQEKSNYPVYFFPISCK